MRSDSGKKKPAREEAKVCVSFDGCRPFYPKANDAAREWHARPEGVVHVIVVVLRPDVARDPGELAAEVDVVLSCVVDGAAVEAVYLGTGGVLRHARPGARIFEMSTVAPETSRKLYQAALEFGIPVLDVAVSGSSPAAEAGTLTLLGGGDRQDFDAAETVFAAIAKQWFYMGPSGSGVAMKLVVKELPVRTEPPPGLTRDNGLRDGGEPNSGRIFREAAR